MLRFFGKLKRENRVATLEQQLEALAALGLRLDDGVTVDDLLHSFSRQDYEQPPFQALLFMMGSEVEREPWGRSVCTRAWNFDTECIESTGDYVSIAERLCVLAGEPDRLTDARDFVDIEAGEAWLEYTVEGKRRRWGVEVNDDWADPLAVTHVMADIERDDSHFYSIDNGQAMILFYLSPAVAAKLNKLSKDPLQRVIPD